MTMVARAVVGADAAHAAPMLRPNSAYYDLTTLKRQTIQSVQYSGAPCHKRTDWY
jgi:hypothetical protein